MSYVNLQACEFTKGYVSVPSLCPATFLFIKNSSLLLCMLMHSLVAKLTSVDWRAPETRVPKCTLERGEFSRVALRSMHVRLQLLMTTHLVRSTWQSWTRKGCRTWLWRTPNPAGSRIPSRRRLRKSSLIREWMSIRNHGWIDSRQLIHTWVHAHAFDCRRWSIACETKMFQVCSGLPDVPHCAANRSSSSPTLFVSVRTSRTWNVRTVRTKIRSPVEVL